MIVAEQSQYQSPVTSHQSAVGRRQTAGAGGRSRRQEQTAGADREQTTGADREQTAAAESRRRWQELSN
ncbi:MAG TPA: hypothetical protein VIF64_16365, partial [Pyrinomonadaceae bacterium]